MCSYTTTKSYDFKGHLNTMHEIDVDLTCDKCDSPCNNDIGIKIGGQALSNLEYSDDIVLMEKSPLKLQRFIDIFEKISKEIGLELNISKTKCMKISKMDTKPLVIRIGQKTAEEVSSFTYLGFEITCDGKDEKAVKARIALGWAAVNKKFDLLKSNVLSMMNKVNIVETYIYPVVRYGLEVVALSKSLKSKIDVFQNDVMRLLTGNNKLDKVRIEKLNEMTNLKNLFEMIKSDKESLFYKTKISVKGVSKLCLEGLVEGKRSRGRPKRRWTDDLKEWSSSNNIQEAFIKIKAKLEK